MSNVSKKLSNGAWVLLRPIPPHYRVAPDVMGELPPEPEAPMKMLESVDGHTESTPAVEGDPQYTAYLVERATWLHDKEAWDARESHRVRGVRTPSRRRRLRHRHRRPDARTRKGRLASHVLRGGRPARRVST